MSWHTPIDSGEYRKRAQEIVGGYLAGEQVLEDAAGQLARVIREWFKRFERESLEVPQRFARILPGSATLFAGLEDVYPGVTDQEATRLKVLLDSAMEKVTGFADGAV
jgi:hypothetical protein